MFTGVKNLGRSPNLEMLAAAFQRTVDRTIPYRLLPQIQIAWIPA